MPNLTHILKLILHGPQPKDEWYEEWSKDPLAEWFLEATVSQKDKPFNLRLKRWVNGDPLRGPLALGLLAGLWFDIDWLAGICIGLLAVLFVRGYIRGKERVAASRPPPSFLGLFEPTIQVRLLSDMWSSGLRGRDVARCLYVQERGGLTPTGLLAFVSITATLLILGYSHDGFLVVIPGFLLMLVAWTRATECADFATPNPFRLIEWTSVARPVPGLRAMRSFLHDGVSTQHAGRHVPFFPFFALPFVSLFTTGAVNSGSWLLVVTYLPIGAACLLSVVLAHRMAPNRLYEDVDLLEDAFAAADRDFDQWVRTELIGDEDA